MSKINYDKYYTPEKIAKYVVNKTKIVIGEDNISEYVEPSAGGGVFLKFLPKETLSYDIEPEHPNIIKQNYLDLDIDYKKGRPVIGNPPFGIRNTLSVRFYKKSIEIGDYISFILPSSQYNNNIQLFEFDLIYSEIIDGKDFEHLDGRIGLCFNIYKRNPKGFNVKPDFKLKDVKIIEKRKGVEKQIPRNFIIGICSFGWSVGKQTLKVGQYANEFYIYSDKYKNEIFELVEKANWREITNTTTSTGKINQWQVYKYIKKNISGIN